MAKDHAFDCATVITVIQGLQLDSDDNKDYKIYYIYCGDNASKKGTGFEMTNKKNVDPKIYAAVKKRVQTCIARVCYYPLLPEVVI